MVSTLNDDATEYVGKYEMQIRFGDRTLESDARWKRRSDILSAWLLEQWRCERARDAHCGNVAVSQIAKRN